MLVHFGDGATTITSSAHPDDDPVEPVGGAAVMVAKQQTVLLLPDGQLLYALNEPIHQALHGNAIIMSTRRVQKK